MNSNPLIGMRIAFALGAASLCCPTYAPGAPDCGLWAERGGIPNPEPLAVHNFGQSVSVSGGLVAIGSTGITEGAIHVYDMDTVTEIGRWATPGAVAGDVYGQSVDLDGVFAISGAPRADPGGLTDAGQAFVYNIFTGELLRKLDSPNPEGDARFGWSVSISPLFALVGAPGAAGGEGRAFLFDLSDGSLLRTIMNPTGATAAVESHGYSVALDRNRALVGEPGWNGNATDYGLAFIFDISNGNHISSLFDSGPPFNKTGFRVGWSVALSGGYAIAGVPGATDSVQGEGRARIGSTRFGAGGLLSNPTPGYFNEFGWSVSIDNNLALVGSLADLADHLADPGSVHLFEAATGQLIVSFEDPMPDAAEEDFYGHAVSISGTRFAVGAPLDDKSGVDSGRVYLYGLDPSCPSPTPLASGTPTPPQTVGPTPSPTATPDPADCCPGDADHSGAVNAGDFLAVQGNFGWYRVTGAVGDANCSGSFVDANDFIAVQANFGADCG